MYEQDHPRSIFTLSKVYFGSVYMGVEEMREIMQLHDDGVAVGSFLLSACMAPISSQHKLPLLKPLCHSFAVSTAVDGEQHTRRPARGIQQVTQVTISELIPPFWLPAVLSAARYSESLRCIAVKSTFARLRLDNCLHWIAYAAFKRRTRLRRLELDCTDFESIDVETIRGVLRANPTSAPNDVVASRFHLLDPLGVTTEAAITYSSPRPLLVPVLTPIADGNEWIRVLLPGCGEAWVHRDDITDTRAPPSALDGITSVKTLALKKITAASCDLINAFLREILPGPKRLEIELLEDITTAEWLHQTAIVCPQLAELQLSGRPIRSLEVFLEGFQSSMLLRVTSLRLDAVLSEDDGDVRRFFEALSDRDHPMASQLRDLAIHLFVHSVEGSGFVDAIQLMFRRNQRLRRVFICIYHRRDLPIPPGHFDALGTTRYMVVPLEGKKRRAFLSTTIPGSGACALLSCLDHNVLSSILDFSAETRKVQIYVSRSSNWVPSWGAWRHRRMELP